MSGPETGAARRMRLPTLFGQPNEAPVPRDEPAHPSRPRRASGWPALASAWSVRHALALLFLLIALPTCAMLALLTPLGQVADEPAHALRAASLLHGQWIGRRETIVMQDGATRTMAGLDADQALLPVLGGSDHPKLAQDYVARARAQDWAGSLGFHQVPSVSIYMPAFYVPAAIGLGIAKQAGAGPFIATYVARLVNVACFLALGLAAMLVAQRGHALLFCTLLFPMTVSLAASVNQDGLIIGASALAAALLTRSTLMASAGPALPRTRSYWTAALLLACVAAVKPPYAPLLLGLLLPLPPLRAWLRLRWPLLRRAATIGLLLLPGLLWGWLTITTVATTFDRPPYEAGPLWPGPRPAVFDGTNPAAQLQVLLAEPSLLLTLPWSTMIHDGLLLRSAVGVLGWLNVYLPNALYALWYLAVPAALVSDLLAWQSGTERRSVTDFALTLTACVSCVLGIYLLQYLSWTSVGHPEVQGVQGRYLLPILPFLAICFPVFKLQDNGRLRVALVTLPIVAAAIGTVVLPLLVVHATILR